MMLDCLDKSSRCEATAVQFILDEFFPELRWFSTGENIIRGKALSSRSYGRHQQVRIQISTQPMLMFLVIGLDLWNN